MMCRKAILTKQSLKGEKMTAQQRVGRKEKYAVDFLNSVVAGMKKPQPMDLMSYLASTGKKKNYSAIRNALIMKGWLKPASKRVRTPSKYTDEFLKEVLEGMKNEKPTTLMTYLHSIGQADYYGGIRNALKRHGLLESLPKPVEQAEGKETTKKRRGRPPKAVKVAKPKVKRGRPRKIQEPAKVQEVSPLDQLKQLEASGTIPPERLEELRKKAQDAEQTRKNLEQEIKNLAA